MVSRGSRKGIMLCGVRVEAKSIENFEASSKFGKRRRELNDSIMELCILDQQYQAQGRMSWGKKGRLTFRNSDNISL